MKPVVLFPVFLFSGRAPTFLWLFMAMETPVQVDTRLEARACSGPGVPEIPAIK